ncbi:MAG TPA: alpha/beta hydrolase [Thermoanaerobaculia bacterium]|nr:alpha/beta hydrolase [Thermoanaerobaculia bacterium]
MLYTTDQGSGTEILWIHGYPLSSRIFAKQLEIPGVRHIVPDLPGFGRSATPDHDMTVDDYARALLKLLGERKVQRAYVAGLSMGGYIALALARLVPERMRGLILIDTKETADTPEARQGRYESVEKVKSAGVRPVVDAMLPKMLMPSAPLSLVEEVRAIMTSSTAAGVMTALKAMAERPDSTALLPHLDMRTLVIVGDGDTITPPADAARMAAAIPNAKLVTIESAAHLSNMEKPDEFNKAVQLFVT